MRTLFITVCVLALHACASQAPVVQAPINLDVGFLDPSQSNKEPYDLHRQVFLNFRLTPGALAGGVMTEGQQSTFVEPGDPLTVDMDHLQRLIEPYAGSMVDTRVNKDVVVEPADTRFARVGVFAYDPLTQKSLGPSGFNVLESDAEELFLVYFDRPAAITGSYQEGEILIEYHINTDRAGFAWLKVIKLEPSLMVVANHSYTGSEFIALPGVQVDEEEDGQNQLVIVSSLP